MLSLSDINILGQCINSTWGSSGNGEFRTPTMSIKSSIQGDNMTCSYTTIVHLASERNLRDQVRRFEEESIKIIKEYVNLVKKDFKAESGRALKVKEVATTDSVELITASPFTPRKTAYYRRFTTFKVE
jgi:hypothetical protein